MKVFISQGVSGRTRKEIIADRKNAENLAREVLGNDVEFKDMILPEKDSLSSGRQDVYILARAIESIADADMVFFAHGWQGVPGCRIVHSAALAYGVPVCDQY